MRKKLKITFLTIMSFVLLLLTLLSIQFTPTYVYRLITMNVADVYDYKNFENHNIMSASSCVNYLLKLSQDENVTAKKRMSMERRFIRIIDVTGKELERLGDQSGKAGILMGEMEKNISAIEKERAAREQITGVIEEFVIGGPEERGNLVSAANGIRQAFATGTLQMQTPEQRQATVGLLDRLGDVKLFGNITGKEIKKQLIFFLLVQFYFQVQTLIVVIEKF